MLESSSGPLSAIHDLAMLDLDGVVYVGPDAVPGAPEHLEAARNAGMHLAFVTNNASRTPERVADHLGRLGVRAVAEDVVTSAQAAAHLLAERHGEGAAVFCLGSDGLDQALRAEGLVPVTGIDRDVVAVVTGYAPEVAWRQVMLAAMLIRDGLPWVASNTDLTVPLPQGLGPGHGVQVQMLSDFSGVEPVVAGKPSRPLLEETMRRVGGRRPLMVGDRLDTDVAGARAVGIDSLLVLTGVTGLEELVSAPAGMRPTYVSTTLAGLMATHEAPTMDQTGDGSIRVELGGWVGDVHHERLRVSGCGEPDAWWRVVATTAWAWRDATGREPDVGPLHAQSPNPSA